MLTRQNKNNQYSKVEIYSYGKRTWIVNVQVNNSFHFGEGDVRNGDVSPTASPITAIPTF
jgi:hypothetical protein